MFTSLLIAQNINIYIFQYFVYRTVYFYYVIYIINDKFQFGWCWLLPTSNKTKQTFLGNVSNVGRRMQFYIVNISDTRSIDMHFRSTRIVCFYIWRYCSRSWFVLSLALMVYMVTVYKFCGPLNSNLSSTRMYCPVYIDAFCCQGGRSMNFLKIIFW